MLIQTSTWVTAYYAYTLGQAMQLGVNPNEKRNLIKYLDFLSKNFDINGTFVIKNYAKVSSNSKPSSKAIHFTCFAVLAFSINQDFLGDDYKPYLNQINESLNYVQDQLGMDNYASSICAYAFAISDRTNASLILLEQLDKGGRTNVDTKFWNLDDTMNDTDSHTRELIAGYTAKAYLYHNNIEKAKPIVKWLMKQRNSNGEFSDSYSTVIAMEALAELAARTKYAKNNMLIKVISEKGYSNDVSITQNNMAIANFMEMPNTLNLTVVAKGTGYALVTTFYEFTKPVNNVSDIFELFVKLSKQNTTTLQVSACVTKRKYNETDQIMMELSLSSGYVYMKEKPNPMGEDKRRIIHVN